MNKAPQIFHVRWWAAWGVMISVIIMTLRILQLNQGMLTFSLDDPYIHLALAENLLHGHYGINADPSAPSSSILWPFLMAPLTLFAQPAYGILLINTVCAVITVQLLREAVYDSFNTMKHGHTLRSHHAQWIASCTAWIIFFALNGVGVIFTGMEHSLQIMMVLLIFHLLRQSMKTRASQPSKASPPQQPLGWLLPVCLLIAPLIRYELLAVTSLALLVLAYWGYRWQAALIFITSIVLLVMFSLFLLSQGLDYLPTSILAKTAVHRAGHHALSQLVINVQSPRGMFLVLLSLPAILLIMMVAKRIFLSSETVRVSNKEALHALLLCLGMGLLMSYAHLAQGRFGWFSRYELYVLFGLIYLYFASAFFWQIGTYSSGSTISVCDSTKKYPKVRRLWMLTSFLAMGVFSWPYLKTTLQTPMACQDIYLQHYQMHRFVRDFYGKAVAANDIGYLAFRNQHQVLDMWGLASLQALKLRLTEKNTEWMDRLVKQNSVELVMIYDTWFPKLPADWVKVAELRMGRKNVVAAHHTVSFYATSPAFGADIAAAQQRMTTTLPPGVQFDAVVKKGE